MTHLLPTCSTSSTHLSSVILQDVFSCATRVLKQRWEERKEELREAEIEAEQQRAEREEMGES